MMTNKPRWIAHNQNCRPARLKPDTLVNVVLKYCQDEIFSSMLAGQMNWNKANSGNPIVAYQITEETK